MIGRKKPVLLVLLSVFVSISLLLVYMFLSNPVFAVQEAFVLAYSEEAKSVLNLTQGKHVSIWLSTLPSGMSGRSAQQYVIEFYITDPTARTVLNATGTVRTGLLSPFSFVAQQSGVYTIHIKNTVGGYFTKTVSLSYRIAHSIYGTPIEYLLAFALAATAVPILIIGVETLRTRGNNVELVRSLACVPVSRKGKSRTNAAWETRDAGCPALCPPLSLGKGDGGVRVNRRGSLSVGARAKP